VKLLVKPIYGWGWYSADSNASVDVPPPFELDAEVIEASEPFRAVLGQLSKGDHLLSGLWILLSQRHSPHDGDCNLRAYAERPQIGAINEPISAKHTISGFASVTVAA
jgi:hypothetical protein